MLLKTHTYLSMSHQVIVIKILIAFIKLEFCLFSTLEMLMISFINPLFSPNSPLTSSTHTSTAPFAVDSLLMPPPSLSASTHVS